MTPVQKCETTCREELLGKIEEAKGCARKKVDRAGMWKTLTIIIAILSVIWGVGYGIHGEGVRSRSKRIDDNQERIVELRESFTECKIRVEGLVISQDKLEKAIMSLLREIRSERKNGKDK